MSPVRTSWLLCLLTAGTAFGQTRALAIVVGNNAGSGDLPALRYAEADAAKVARVLTELGGVAAEDALLLQGTGEVELEQAFGAVRERIAAQKGSETVVYFYFSGHSDGEALELGRDTVSYSQLRALLEGTAADVRVAVVDACKSGGGFAKKGGRATTRFPLRIVDALQARGEVFISSSESDEAAHESKEIRGGLFTHHLLSGLRGLADLDGDRKVTLFEAYRYAYQHTLAATQWGVWEGQHATFDYRLSGRGELAVTVLAEPPASLTLPEGTQRALVFDVARDQVVAESAGGPGPRSLALAPGRYALKVTKDGQTRTSRFELHPAARWAVEWVELQSPRAAVEWAEHRR